MRKTLLTILCMLTISANAARMVDGVNYDVDRDNLTATVVALDNYTSYSGDIVIPSKLTIGSYTFTVVSIGQGAFSGSDITSISLPNTIVDIQTAAFGSCRRLKELSLPDGVKTIGESAFQGCESITKLKLPDNDVMLGSRAFCRLNSLQELSIPDSWTQIGNEKASEVFWSCTSLKKLTVGKKVETIWNSAFSGCTSLSEIICPADGSLTYIAQGAFSNCHSITSMKFIPPTVKKIGSYAFEYCKGLEEIFIPKTVEVLYCGGNWQTSTTKLVIEDGSTPLVQIGGRSIIYASEVYLGRPIDAELSDGVPFYNTYLTKLTFGPMFTGNNEWNFGKKLKEIYSYVTDPSVINCTFDENVYDNATLYVPKGTKAAYMAKYNFAPFFDIQEMAGEKPEVGKVFNLNVGGNEIPFKVTSNSPMEVEVAKADQAKVSGSINIPKTVEIDGYTYSITCIGVRAFQGCSDLTSVTIPNSVTTIERGAFSGCTGLTSVNIPNSVTTIGYNAFEGCTGLTSATIPKSVISIGDNPFAECIGLTSIKVESGNTNYDSRDNCNAIIETKTNKLISGCMNTIIPNSMTSIGDQAFRGFSSLTSITIPNSVTSIGGFAFSECSGLTSVTISNSVTSIGGYAFHNCSGLTSVTIPNSVTSIGTCAFSRCTGLTSVIIPNSVISIREFAFSYCSSLTSVTISNSVTSIGGYAFKDCIALKDVYCYAEKIPDGDSSIFDIDSDDDSYRKFIYRTAILHVPSITINAYKNTSPWSGFGNIVALKEGDPSGIEAIKNGKQENNTPVYNLNGQRVDTPTKGIYIKNGRKVLVK